ncbi:MAG: DsbA family protein, partial [Planctomycetota bacterium]
SNALAVYAEGDRVPLRPARGLIGPGTAPVRITGFSDILCGHCADLHRTVELLREKLPRGSFAFELRQFPLDGDCNSAIEMSTGDGVRCLAARALICAEEESMAFADALYENQRRLTTEKIYDLAEPFMPRERLEDCVASPETEAKLEDDIEWATEHEIVGTPLVLVNGREGSPAVHFLFAMVLARADPEHPAFDVLPPPGLRPAGH